jgi:hypothetical protein
MSCPYANALGVPGEGVHAARVFGMAFNDWLMTALLAAVLAWFFNIPFLYTLLGLFVVGEVLHYVYGVKTAFLRGVGLDPLCAEDGLIRV